MGSMGMLRNSSWVHIKKTKRQFLVWRMFSETRGRQVDKTPELKSYLVHRCPDHQIVLCSDQISRSVVSDSLRPHESKHARPPCLSPTPRVHWDSRPWSHYKIMDVSILKLCWWWLEEEACLPSPSPFLGGESMVVPHYLFIMQGNEGLGRASQIFLPPKEYFHKLWRHLFPF